MKRLTTLMLVTVLAVVVVAAPGADAGLFKKSKNQRTEKPEWMKRPQRYEGAPQAFHAGVLQQDGLTGWKIGETSLRLTKDCLISSDGQEKGQLDAGRKVVVMGPKIGDTIFAWSVRVTRPDFALGAPANEETRLAPSKANPSCGEILRAPQ